MAVTNRASRKGNAVGCVRLSICLFPLCSLNRLNSELYFVGVWRS